MEVTNEIITEATSLDMEGINFYRDRKMFGTIADEFAESAKERKRLVKVNNS